MANEKIVLSHSAIISFLNNQIQFKKRYIAKIYDDPTTPAMLVGKAIHKMIEEVVKKKPIEMAIQLGLQEIENVSDYEIDYGKNGSREEILSSYQKLTTAVMNELTIPSNVLSSEDKIECNLTILNKQIPFKGYIDLVLDNQDSLEIWDYKTVRYYSDEGVENWKYIIQAWLYCNLVEYKYKKPVSRFVFKEIKSSVNRDGNPQIKDYILTRDAINQATDVIGRLVKNISDYIDNPNAIYFPNPSDALNGNRSVEIMAMMDGVSVRTVHTTERKAKFTPVNTVIAEDIAKDDGSESDRIMAKLAEFGIGGKIENIVKSNTVDTYILKPNRGIKMSKIATMGDDLSLALGSEAIRVIAPIYGTQTVGIEVPHEQKFPIFDGTASTNMIPIGVDTMNNVVYDDIAKMPHMLIGGQTGSGKSVFIKNIIKSLDCSVTIIDCKMVDFADMNGGKIRVITERDDAIAEIEELVELMEYRYATKNLNASREVLVIDEYADLIMGMSKEEKRLFENNLSRILQKARVANINVIIATQRPSADIVAPIIKANCPVKACLRVSTTKNSEIIIDQGGGERLLGKGDMLYLGTGMINPVRLQCFSPIN